MLKNCSLPSAFLSSPSLPHRRPTRGSHPPISPGDDECLEEVLTEIEDWHSTKWRHIPPRTVHSEVFFGLGFGHGRTRSLAGDPDTRTSEPGGKGTREWAGDSRPYISWLLGLPMFRRVGPWRRAKELMLSSRGAGKDSGEPWTARRSNQSILKEISPDHSLEGLMLEAPILWPPDVKSQILQITKNITLWEKTKYRAYLQEEEKFWVPVWFAQSQSQKSDFLHCCFHLQFHQQSCLR